jgi:replication initiation protein RepC
MTPMTTILTTPFGRRPQSLAQIALQRHAHDFAQASSTDNVVSKWRIFRALSESARRFGLADRSLTVLHALLSFHPETALTVDADAPTIIVFPSSRELETRSNSMPASTLRRHLAALVKAGLIIRRDSPNGKRFARKGHGDEIELAYGFDIAPLVVRASEILAAAAAKKAEDRQRAMLRERITLHRRNIASLIETGLAAALPGPWMDFTAQLATISAKQSRNATGDALASIVTALAELQQWVEEALQTPGSNVNMSAKDSHSERHIQIQTPTESESEPAPEKAGGPDLPQSQPVSFPVTVLTQAFPTAVDYARNEIRTQNDIINVAELVRPMLEISPDAWRDAKETMGAGDAAIAILAILQRGETIKSPGGYLRVLTAKKRAGAFSIGPIVMASLNSKRNEAKASKAASRAGGAEGERLTISPALLQSLLKPRS